MAATSAAATTIKFVKDADITHRLKPGKNLLAVICTNKGNEPNPAGFVALADDRIRPRRSRW